MFLNLSVTASVARVMAGTSPPGGPPAACPPSPTGSPSPGSSVHPRSMLLVLSVTAWAGGAGGVALLAGPGSAGLTALVLSVVGVTPLLPSTPLSGPGRPRLSLTGPSPSGFNLHTPHLPFLCTY